jgi:hypothetical protein
MKIGIYARCLSHKYGGVKEYASSKDKDLNLLASYAELFRVNKELKRYLEVLL